MTPINKVTILILVLLVTNATSYYYGYKKPAKVETKTVVKHDTKTIVKEIERPDGTKEKQTIIVDKTKTSNKEKQSPAESKWLFGASYNLEQDYFKAAVSRRVLGPFFVTGEVSSKKEIFIGLTYEF